MACQKERGSLTPRRLNSTTRKILSDRLNAFQDFTDKQVPSFRSSLFSVPRRFQWIALLLSSCGNHSIAPTGAQQNIRVISRFGIGMVHSFGMKHDGPGQIIGAAMAVLYELKPGLDEKLYENALGDRTDHSGVIPSNNSATIRCITAGILLASWCQT